MLYRGSGSEAVPWEDKEYWEAWRVMRGSDTPFQSGKYDDEYANKTQLLCSKGTIEIIGKLYFYEKGYIPFGYEIKEGHAASELPTGPLSPEDTEKKDYNPSVIKKSSGVNHSIKVKWNCCPKKENKNPTVMVSKTP